MRFRTLVTSGGEVVFAGQRHFGPTYYGAPTETGLWRISMPSFEGYMAAEFEPLFFGRSIEEFDFGFEIAELNEWGRWFKATSDYVSYRPKSKLLISVGQLEWKVVKDLPANEQLERLCGALMTAIERIDQMKPKPKDFDRLAFAQTMREVLNKCKLDMVLADASDA